jgi:hypothetical protein
MGEEGGLTSRLRSLFEAVMTIEVESICEQNPRHILRGAVRVLVVW